MFTPSKLATNAFASSSGNASFGLCGLFDEPYDVFRLIRIQTLPDVSACPIKNELDFLSVLIDNDVCLYDNESPFCGGQLVL
jgi:hypothetical protein